LIYYKFTAANMSLLPAKMASLSKRE